MKDTYKIKVLHITQVGGGIETYLEQSFNNIDKEKFEMELAFPYDRKSIVKMVAKYNITHYPLYLKWKISPFDDIISIFSIIKLVKKVKPDLVHAHSSKAGMIARLASTFYKPPVIYTPNAFAYLGSTGIARKILMLLEKMAIPFTDVLLAASKSEAIRSIVDLSYPKRKVEVYPNSIEILPVHKKTESNPPEPIMKKVTTVGRLVNQKNPIMFLNTCKIICGLRDDVLFQIIGAGFEDRLKDEIYGFIEKNSLQEKVAILPWVDRVTLLDMITDTDVFVMTSTFESFGYVAAEAQMLEIPVVATNVDGLNEIVENDVTGYLVDLNDAKAMAAKIVYLIDNPVKAREMGQKGRSRIIDMFDIKKNIKILERFYTEQCKMKFEKP